VGAAKDRGSAIDLGPAPRVKLGSFSDSGIPIDLKWRGNLSKLSNSRSELPGHSAKCFEAEPYLEAIS
jgi:hypothetical protein